MACSLFTFSIQCIVFQARINWEGCGSKGIRSKTEGDDGGGDIDGLDGVK